MPKGMPNRTYTTWMLMNVRQSGNGASWSENYSSRMQPSRISGKHLYALMLTSPTRLEIKFCSIVLHGCTTPQISLTPKRGTSGDLLPIPPWNITVDIPGVSEGNEMWIKAISMRHQLSTTVLGWSKPICVPFKDGLSELQIAAVSEMAKVVTEQH